MQTIAVLTANNLSSAVSSVTFRPMAGFPSDLYVTASIDNGAGLAPTSAPVGTFILRMQVNGAWSQIVDSYGTLAAISPAGNTLVLKTAIMPAAPPALMRIDYVPTSGGGAGTSCTLTVQTH